MSIVKMKHIRLFGMAADRETLLRQLQHLGCVEISEPTDKLADPDWAALTRVDDAGLARWHKQRTQQIERMRARAEKQAEEAAKNAAK